MPENQSNVLIVNNLDPSVKMAKKWFLERLY
jgi:hypothetical protein